MVIVMENSIDTSALFKLSYGLFVLTTRDGDKDNGCIINTAMQITSSPLRISIAVNRTNFSCQLIEKTGVFNICVLTQSTAMNTFERFGFKSGKDSDKFDGAGYENRSANGLRYVPEQVNCVISGKVYASHDYGTHVIFIADITECFILSDEPSVTYQYYFDHIKPKAVGGAPAVGTGSSDTTGAGGTKRFVCRICGYVYDGSSLPDDFVCPLCKHGKEDFEELT
jgi:flavin reductase (DIM6/NTAB) family NADH-FMN oxidoreductase RutF/rubredoxin